jgi:hypothetical protein
MRFIFELAKKLEKITRTPKAKAGTKGMTIPMATAGYKAP